MSTPGQSRHLAVGRSLLHLTPDMSPRRNADLLFSRVLPTRLTPNVRQHLFCRRFIRSGFLFHLRSLRLR